MKKKIKILRIITSLNPKYGGPSRATVESSLNLVKQGFEVHILTRDQSNSNFFKDKNVKVFNKGSYLKIYDFNLRLLFWFLKNRVNYEKIIVHGIWEFNTFLVRIFSKKKYYVFAHGQLDPFFATQKFKKIKKQIYWYLFERKNLLLSKALILTSLIEKKLLDKTFVNTKGITKKVISYGVNPPKFNKKKVINLFYRRFPNLKNEKFLLFLGRFHQKKGCDDLIKAIKKVNDKGLNIKVLFVGPLNSYKTTLQMLSSKYKLDNNIFWSNMLLDDLKWGAINASSAMVLSSNGENFGVSLVESLSCSKPVLTTSKVGIHKEISIFKAGFVSKNNSTSFSKILEKFTKLNKSSLKVMSANALNCYNYNFNLSKSKNDLGKYLLKID